MNRLFGDAYGAREEGVLSNWVPAVDIFENEKKELVLKAELPDVKSEDVAVTVENNMLTIQRRAEARRGGEEGTVTTASSASFGSFSRSFSLPTTVDTGKIARRLQERRADRAPAVPRGSQAALDQHRSGGVSPHLD